MSKYEKMSAKDKAFEREKTKLRSTIQQKDEEIIRLKQEVAKYKLEAESWENTARILEARLGVPKEEIIADINRTKKLEGFLSPIMTMNKYL